MKNPLYELYYVIEKILKRINDPNEQRFKENGQWIFPTIPTGLDDDYPRITVQLSNIEEEPVGAGGYIDDNFSSNDAVKCKVNGKVYILTFWIGLFIKRELPGKIEFPDGSVKLAKNTLFGNLLFEQLLKELDKGISDINEVAYYYNPFDKSIDWAYEDENNRLVYSVSLNIPVLAEIETIFNADELIEIVTRNYEARINTINGEVVADATDN